MAVAALPGLLVSAGPRLGVAEVSVNHVAGPEVVCKHQSDCSERRERSRRDYDEVWQRAVELVSKS